ncbi:hypothetical protein B9Z19DRAFT_1064977 [Tuber borchii]|uniref:Uncharacterized protein n=1 Tax=Tuber borchii TaxID=42251 RepID=A0A2T6ZSS4_TUBBO|nr:hypothetical protein B9Z19DRAFT_1064977 [Tuber borchii]
MSTKMSGNAEICHLPSPALVSAPTYAINSRILERSVYQERVRRHSTSSQTPKPITRRAEGPRYETVISQSLSPAQSAAADPTPIPDVIKLRGDGTEVRFSGGRRNSLIRREAPREKRGSRAGNETPSLGGKHLESSPSSDDEGEGSSGSDTASEYGSS